ncbi:uncharacterized protein LOC132601591 [Lycium barbarum]|uniref:uncharacterized protein LOC132601591 n=1 Tax=Lycium barbarum TaxID=112863 RepID=UPI00293E4F11|nr:uncharacterized protein LOC132601591 [Lycium barbarum]
MLTPDNQAPQNQTFQNQPPPVNYKAPQRKPMRAFTPLSESRTSLFAKLRDAGRVNVVPPKPANPTDQWYRPDLTCAYHSNQAGHPTEYCINLRHKLQDMIKNRELILEPTPSNVDTNLLPKHGGNQIHIIERGDEWEESPTIIRPNVEGLESTVASLSLQEREEVVDPLTKGSEISAIAKREPFMLKYSSTVSRVHNEPFVLRTSASIENKPFLIKPPHQMMINKDKEIANVVQGMTRSGRCYAPEEPVPEVPRRENPQKKPIAEGEAGNFLRQMPVMDYLIVEHLHKNPTRISVMSLLFSSSQHRLALMKALDEIQVPIGTTSETFAEIMGYVVRAHRLSFSDDELPREGKSHNKTLHITVKYRDKIIPQVLIDGGAGLNVCPVTTLKQLGYDIGKIRQSRTNVKAYDGATSDPIGEIDLHI